MSKWVRIYREHGEAGFEKQPRKTRNTGKMPEILTEIDRAYPLKSNGQETGRTEPEIEESGGGERDRNTDTERKDKKKDGTIDDYGIGYELEKAGYAAHRIIRVLELKERTYYHRKRNPQTEKKKKSGGRPCKRYSEVADFQDLNSESGFITDEGVGEILLKIYGNENRDDPHYYVKTMGSKKLSVYRRREKSIIINHKKLDRMRKESGWMRTYTTRKHMYNTSKEHLVCRPDKLWQVDIKMYRTRTQGLLQVLSFITHRHT